MVSALMAIQLIQAQPAVRPAPKMMTVPRLAPPVLISQKQRVVGEARALLARAEAERNGQPANAELEAALEETKSQADSLSEMSEADSLALQAAMDRLSKLMSTMSNLLKKMSETQASITGNIK